MADPLDGARPADVTAELAALNASLGRVIPAKAGGNLLLGTWNVRAFDQIFPAWRSQKGDSPIRDLSNVACIAEVVRRFDVVAVQEVRSGSALLLMMQALGPGWSFLVTDLTGGAAGNHERLAFVFDSNRLTLSGLACELVEAPQDSGLLARAMTGQFARTPYAVSFSTGSKRFTLVTLHVVYGKSPADRVPELTAIADWLQGWAAGTDPWGHNLIALGDFNIDRKDDPLYQAFTSTGLTPPPALNYVPRTIFDSGDPNAKPDQRHFYDQIAWFTAGKGKLDLALSNAGTFDFTDGTIPATDRTQLSWRISDHYPLWCECSTAA